MTKPVRSPILGYNHNIQFHGHVFHVQTEDSGAQHARLFTHLFVGGTILASKKEAYDATAPEDAVRLLMQRLHKSMIKELKDGVHDPSIQGFFAARGEHIQLGDRPSLVQVPVVEPATAAGQSPAQVADDRPPAVSGSFDTPSPPARATTPAPARTPAPVRKPVVVVKPPDLKRPPVVVTSSAEGVVVMRNVVINVGGGSAPVQGQISRGTAMPRPAVPYVVRDGSYPMPTVSRGTSAHAAATPPAEPASPPSARDVRMPWDAPASGEPAPRTQTPRPPPEHTPTSRATGSGPGLRARPPGPPSERTPTESAFSTDLPSDKSLDEVILEYLSDDPE
ncbi:MAG TPA: hypothetical protein VG319_01810 [Polyangia bacterium]|jgi:hypothetical protein|nr:hypothetical protein [Polyangia bacterium]